MRLETNVLSHNKPIQIAKGQNRNRSEYLARMDLGKVQVIDANGFDRIAASRNYANRTNYTFKEMKATMLVDYSLEAILHVNC